MLQGKKKRSFLPALIAIELIFTTYWILCVNLQGVLSLSQTAPILSVPILQGLWAACIIRNGPWFAQERILRSFPMVWLPLFPFVVQTAVFQLWQWETISELLRHQDSYQSVLMLQGLRVLAVGSLIKWKHGLFPTAFAWGTAFPDMIFGISTWWVLALLTGTEEPAWQLLALWNAAGLLLILPAGILIVQLGMAPTRLYPSTRAPYKLVFEYPMVLGPAVVVPILLSWNGLLFQFAVEKLQQQ